MQATELLLLAQRLQAIAQTGLTYSTSGYDIERYQEVQAISFRLMAALGNGTPEAFAEAFSAEWGYPTPKVDVRVVVFRGTEEILMVQEKIDDNRWTLPGGWADVGYSPFEVAEKEAREETGLEVRAERLLAVFDKRKHAHPPQPWYVYKFFIHCVPTGGALLSDTNETAGCRWMRRAELAELPLSVDRATLAQIDQMFSLVAQPGQPVHCD